MIPQCCLDGLYWKQEVLDTFSHQLEQVCNNLTWTHQQLVLLYSHTGNQSRLGDKLILEFKKNFVPLVSVKDFAFEINHCSFVCFVSHAFILRCWEKIQWPQSHNSAVWGLSKCKYLCPNFSPKCMLYFIRFINLFGVVFNSVKILNSYFVIWPDMLEDIHSATWKQRFGFVQSIMWSKYLQ